MFKLYFSRIGIEWQSITGIELLYETPESFDNLVQGNFNAEISQRVYEESE
ncbi:MAG: hypothetical protein WBV94_16180 [Blastocatellia bacterium]